MADEPPTPPRLRAAREYSRQMDKWERDLDNLGRLINGGERKTASRTVAQLPDVDEEIEAQIAAKRGALREAKEKPVVHDPMDRRTDLTADTRVVRPASAREGEQHIRTSATNPSSVSRKLASGSTSHHHSVPTIVGNEYTHGDTNPPIGFWTPSQHRKSHVDPPDDVSDDKDSQQTHARGDHLDDA